MEEKKKQEEIDIIVNQLSEWQSQDDKKRAVMVVAVDKIDDECYLTAALKGANGVLLPALIDIQKRKEWQILFFSSLLLSKSLP